MKRSMCVAVVALAAMLAAPDRVASIKAFQARGDWRKAFAALSSHLRPGAPGFNPPNPQYVLAPAPGDLSRAFRNDFARRARAYLAGGREVAVAGRPAKLSAIVVIPQGFAPGAR